MGSRRTAEEEMSREILEIKRIKIRSVIRVTFLFHVFVGLIIGLLLSAGWGIITVFDMQEFVPSFLGDVGDPETASLLILLSLTAVAFGVVGALIWSLITLLYNVIAGFVRGIRIEVEAGKIKKKGDQGNGG